MQFIDLKTQYSKIQDLVQSGLNVVLEHGRYIMGPEIVELEKQLADFTGRKHCVGCSSGTDALLMALMAYDIGPGDAVFTSPFTFVATAEVIALLGATTVFVDIDKDTYNINPAELEKAIEKVKAEGKLNPKVIMPVNIFGLCADYDSIIPMAEKYGLKVIEDAAQSFGAELNGKRSCSYGDISATSFFPAKPLGCYGDGGAVFTDDDDLYEKLVSIRMHGQGTDRYENVRIGINGRLDSFQAAVLLAKMTIFESEIELRQTVANTYSELLKSKFKVPTIPVGYKSAWAQYSIIAESEAHKNQALDKLKSAQIPFAVYYPIPLHLQKAFANLNYKEGDLPVSEDYAKRIFSLPMHPYLSKEEIETICDILL